MSRVAEEQRSLESIWFWLQQFPRLKVHKRDLCKVLCNFFHGSFVCETYSWDSIKDRDGISFMKDKDNRLEMRNCQVTYWGDKCLLYQYLDWHFSEWRHNVEENSKWVLVEDSTWEAYHGNLLVDSFKSYLATRYDFKVFGVEVRDFELLITSKRNYLSQIRTDHVADVIIDYLIYSIYLMSDFIILDWRVSHHFNLQYLSLVPHGYDVRGNEVSAWVDFYGDWFGHESKEPLEICGRLVLLLLVDFFKDMSVQATLNHVHHGN